MERVYTCTNGAATGNQGQRDIDDNNPYEGGQYTTMFA